MRDVLYELPKAIYILQNLLLPSNEIVEVFSDVPREAVKFIISSNLFDIYTRLETLLGLNLSGHTDSLIEASNLIDEIKKGEIQNKQHYQKAVYKFHNI